MERARFRSKPINATLVWVSYGRHAERRRSRPRFPPARGRWKDVLTEGPPGTEGRPVLLPEGRHPGLHEGGVFLPRQPLPGAVEGGDRPRREQGRSREPREVPGEVLSLVPAPLGPRGDGLERLRGVEGEEPVREDVHGDRANDLRDR